MVSIVITFSYNKIKIKATMLYICFDYRGVMLHALILYLMYYYDAAAISIIRVFGLF